MISKKDVQHIAKLARLGLSKKEEEKFARDLSSILDYMQKLEKVDILNVKPTSHPHLIENVTRDDKERRDPLKRINKLIEAVPEKKKGYIKVKAVF